MPAVCYQGPSWARDLIYPISVVLVEEKDALLQDKFLSVSYFLITALIQYLCYKKMPLKHSYFEIW